jgi:hypothetical protein
MDWLTDLVANGVAEFHSDLFDTIPKNIQDGGAIALLVAVLVAIAALVYKAATDEVGRKLAAWFTQENRLLVVCIAGLLAAIGMMSGRWGTAAVVIILGGLWLFGRLHLRLLLGEKRNVWIQAGALLLLFMCETYLLSVHNAGRRYLVLLAFDVEAGGVEEPVQRLSQQYLDAHSLVFRDLASMQVIPSQYDKLEQEHLTSRRAAFQRLPSYISQRIGRTRFCPALVVTTTVELTHYPEVNIYSDIRGVPPDRYESAPLDNIRLKGENVQFLGLRSAIWLMSALHNLRCDTQLHRRAQDKDKDLELVLSPREEQTALHKTLSEYKHWVTADLGDSSPLSHDVDKALQSSSISSADVVQLLNRFPHTTVTPEEARKTRCAALVKANLDCDDNT